MTSCRLSIDKFPAEYYGRISGSWASFHGIFVLIVVLVVDIIFILIIIKATIIIFRTLCVSPLAWRETSFGKKLTGFGGPVACTVDVLHFNQLGIKVSCDEGLVTGIYHIGTGEWNVVGKMERHTIACEAEQQLKYLRGALTD